MGEYKKLDKAIDSIHLLFQKTYGRRYGRKSDLRKAIIATFRKMPANVSGTALFRGSITEIEAQVTSQSRNGTTVEIMADLETRTATYGPVIVEVICQVDSGESSVTVRRTSDDSPYEDYLYDRSVKRAYGRQAYNLANIEHAGAVDSDRRRH